MCRNVANQWLNGAGCPPADVGYEYINVSASNMLSAPGVVRSSPLGRCCTPQIDDCWPAMSRSPSGELLADPERFPGGLKAVADYVHGKGLKLGTYLDIGTTTCGGFPGFNVSALDDQGPEPQYVKDIKALAAAGIDSLKVDGCNADPRVMNITYPKLGDALNATGRPILYSCSWPDYVRSSFGNGAVRELRLLRI